MTRALALIAAAITGAILAAGLAGCVTIHNSYAGSAPTGDAAPVARATTTADCGCPRTDVYHDGRTVVYPPYGYYTPNYPWYGVPYRAPYYGTPGTVAGSAGYDGAPPPGSTGTGSVGGTVGGPADVGGSVGTPPRVGQVFDPTPINADPPSGGSDGRQPTGTPTQPVSSGVRRAQLPPAGSVGGDAHSTGISTGSHNDRNIGGTVTQPRGNTEVGTRSPETQRGSRIGGVVGGTTGSVNGSAGNGTTGSEVHRAPATPTSGTVGSAGTSTAPTNGSSEATSSIPRERNTQSTGTPTGAPANASPAEHTQPRQTTSPTANDVRRTDPGSAQKQPAATGTGSVRATNGSEPAGSSVTPAPATADPASPTSSDVRRPVQGASSEPRRAAVTPDGSVTPR